MVNPIFILIGILLIFLFVTLKLNNKKAYQGDGFLSTYSNDKNKYPYLKDDIKLINAYTMKELDDQIKTKIKQAGLNNNSSIIQLFDNNVKKMDIKINYTDIKDLIQNIQDKKIPVNSSDALIGLYYYACNMWINSAPASSFSSFIQELYYINNKNSKTVQDFKDLKNKIDQLLETVKYY